MKLTYFAVFNVLSLLTFGCGSAPANGVFDQREALTEATHGGYFTVRGDDRHCASPICGGYFLKSVNNATTQCFDGSAAAECYVGALDLGKLGLTEAQVTQIKDYPNQFLFRGIIKSRNFTGPLLGVLETNEVWQGHASTSPSGTFYSAKSSNIQCVTSPCPSFTGYELNLGAEPRAIHEVDVSSIVSEGNDGSDASAQLFHPLGLMVAGETVSITGPAGQGIALRANEYYLPLQTIGHACNSDEACGAGGYCDFGFGVCNTVNANGYCKAKPQTCPYNYDPVCGCDGLTYANECGAHIEASLINHAGACENTPQAP